MKFKKLDKPIILHNELWHIVASGNYIKPGDILEDSEDIKKIIDAIALICDFEIQAYNAGVIKTT